MFKDAPLLQTAFKAARRHHAYLLVGQEVERLQALTFECAQALLCEQQGCTECKGCRAVLANTHPDVITTYDETLNIEAMRKLIERVHVKPQWGLNKVVVLSHAENLALAAQNALLKTLEEPPLHTYFILTTTMPKALKITLRSRCLVVRLHIPSFPKVCSEMLMSAVDTLLTQKTSVAEVLQWTQTLGDKTDEALLVLEQRTCALLKTSPTKALFMLAENITQLRLQAPKYFNRTLALEHLLLSYGHAS